MKHLGNKIFQTGWEEKAETGNRKLERKNPYSGLMPWPLGLSKIRVRKWRGFMFF
jgi:hypothetical protein